MIVVAALAIGTFCALLVGTILGVLPDRGPRRRPPRAADHTRTWIAQAGLTMTAGQFVAGSAGAGGIVLLLLGAVTGSVFVAFVPAVAVALLPRAYFTRRRRDRLRSLQAAWPDGLRDVLASISAGRSLTQAVGALATWGPPALRETFARFPELARVLGTGPALEVVKEELSDPTSDRILEVLILAHDRGGAIVRTILEDLVDATTRDVKLLDELETEGLEMRINSRAVLVLPWLVLVALTAQAGPFRDFYRSGGGVVTLLVGAGLSAVGAVVLGRLGRANDEPRVFARVRATS